VPVEPDEEQIAELAALAGSEQDGPVVMLNLNRYRPRAAYAGDVPGGEPGEVSGRVAYERYGEAALGVLARVGGRILWHAEATRIVIGDAGDRCDEVIAVWYPDLAAFVALATAPETLAARPHRLAGLERATLLCCTAEGAPVPATG
jgi:uncharacterized protein (DUF1330 family)